MAKKPVKGRASAKGGGGGSAAGVKMLILASIVISVPFLLPTLSLMFFTLAPTFVAAIAERGQNRYAWLCVGGTNFAGLSPYLFELWMRGHTMSAAVDILTNVVALLVIYGAAGAGWMLYVGVPPVVAAFLQIMAQRRISTLRAIQKRLVDEWGNEIVRAAKDQA